MQFKHRDVDIQFREKLADFTATVAGTFVVRDSLAAMKKYIDKQASNSFTAFTALSCLYGSPTLDEVQVTGIVPKGRGRFSKPKWQIDNRNTTDCVAEKSQENIKRIKAYQKKSAKHGRLIEKSEAELEKLFTAIVKLKPLE